MDKIKSVIIVGSGIAGLLAARVLSDYAQEVIVIEKDLVTEETLFAARAGVPQALHAHFLTATGTSILTQLFPHLEQTLLAHGSQKIDFLNDLKHFQHGNWLPRMKSDIQGFAQTRVLLEGCIRMQLKEYHNVTFLYQHEVQGILANPKQQRITGVRIKNTSTHEEHNRYADLIVDASGRTSHFPDWLEGLGLQRPDKTEVKMDVEYLSCNFLLPSKPDWNLLTVFRDFPKKKSATTMLIESPEGEYRCLSTMMGQHGDTAVNSLAGFLEFAQQLETPEVYKVLKEAKAISTTAPFKIPTAWRFHYEKLKNLPKGFLAIGDSMCGLNPIYAQGMSIAALEVNVLSQLLHDTTQLNLDTVCQAYFTSCSKVIDLSWQSTTLIDFSYAETQGKRPFLFGLKKWYQLQVIHAMQNPVIWQRLVEIKNLLKSANSLFEPAILFRVLKNIFTNPLKKQPRRPADKLRNDVASTPQPPACTNSST